MINYHVDWDLIRFLLNKRRQEQGWSVYRMSRELHVGRDALYRLLAEEATHLNTFNLFRVLDFLSIYDWREVMKEHDVD